ncbi:hypothetical protein M747DRAFT_315818 [Aspergillus niger ATCC 13496]|uniref:TPR-like protein n=1 Tax=Aspergillus niger ATCC 13496 TaxID=1353008 RepID=A0A370C0C7_ASPNG|nr:hypothetical protein M747DRAFT_315818 [Aspergillus niger ATCC 13496]
MPVSRHTASLTGLFRLMVEREHHGILNSVNNLGLVLNRQGNYNETKAMYRRDLEESKKMLGPEHPDMLTSNNNLGLKILRPEHPDTPNSINNLRSVLDSQGKYKETKVIYHQMSEAREKVLGRDHPDMLTSVSHLGSLYTIMKHSTSRDEHLCMEVNDPTDIAANILVVTINGDPAS